MKQIYKSIVKDYRDILLDIDILRKKVDQLGLDLVEDYPEDAERVAKFYNDIADKFYKGLKEAVPQFRQDNILNDTIKD